VKAAGAKSYGFLPLSTVVSSLRVGRGVNSRFWQAAFAGTSPSTLKKNFGNPPNFGASVLF